MALEHGKTVSTELGYSEFVDAKDVRPAPLAECKDYHSIVRQFGPSRLGQFSLEVLFWESLDL